MLATNPPLESSEPPRRSSGLAPVWLACVLLLLVVLVGGYLLWSAGQDSRAETAQLQSQMRDMAGRIAALEARPLPTPPPPPVDLRPLQNSLADLQGKVTALENKPPPVAALNEAGHEELAALSGRLDTVAAREDQLGTREQDDVAELGKRVDALTSQVAAAVKAGSTLSTLAAQQTRTAQMQAAAAALANGQPLGAIPGAPPALAKFATEPPPTEASLRLSFDAAAKAAHAAGQPPPSSLPFLDRVWQRAQASVTVKSGDKVIVGDSLSDTLEASRRLLDAGDLAGAVKALDGLTGPAGEAMAPWRTEAQSLLDARAALTAAAHG